MLKPPLFPAASCGRAARGRTRQQGPVSILWSAVADASSDGLTLQVSHQLVAMLLRFAEGEGNGVDSAAVIFQVYPCFNDGRPDARQMALGLIAALQVGLSSGRKPGGVAAGLSPLGLLFDEAGGGGEGELEKIPWG